MKLDDLKGATVMIGFPCGPNIPWQTAMALVAATRAATKIGVNLFISTVANNSDVCNARSVVLTQFVDHEEKPDRLFWIDSDIDFYPQDFLRLIALSLKYPVVAATYPLKRDELSFVINGAETDGQYTMNGDGLMKVDSVGLGFSIIQRKPLEELVAASKPRKDSIRGATFYDVFHREEAGEDVSFFRDLKKLGYDVWLDPTICLGHVGPKVYRGDPVEALGLTPYFKTERT